MYVGTTTYIRSLRVDYRVACMCGTSQDYGGAIMVDNYASAGIVMVSDSSFTGNSAVRSYCDQSPCSKDGTQP